MYRKGEVHLRATWIFTWVDVIANLGVFASGFVVWLSESKYADLVVGVVSESEIQSTLSVLRGWHPAVQRRNGHAEVLGNVLGRYAAGQQLLG